MHRLRRPPLAAPPPPAPPSCGVGDGKPARRDDQQEGISGAREAVRRLGGQRSARRELNLLGALPQPDKRGTRHRGERRQRKQRGEGLRGRLRLLRLHNPLEGVARERVDLRVDGGG